MFKTCFSLHRLFPKSILMSHSVTLQINYNLKITLRKPLHRHTLHRQYLIKQIREAVISNMHEFAVPYAGGRICNQVLHATE